MLARVLRWWIAVETSLYLGCALWLNSRGLIDHFGAAVFVLGIPLLIRAAWVAGLFIWRAKSRKAGPPLAPLSAWGWLKMGAREWMAVIRLFGLIMPFEARLMKPDRLRPAPGHTPVVLVHGYHCNRGAWLWLREAIESRGYLVATVNLEPLSGDIDTLALTLAKRIGEVLTQTGATRVSLIGHSMGGLVSQAYLRQHGGGRIAKLITLGTPFGGSRLAHLGSGRSARQMQPGNPWLMALNATPATLGVETINLYSLHDAYVAPQAALLDGARPIGFAGIAHLEMAWHPAIFEKLCSLLETQHPEKQAA